MEQLYKITDKEISGKCKYKFDSSNNDINNNTFLVGVSQDDITPPPLMYTSGYSIGAKRSIGKWTNLVATTFYIEDSSGEKVVFISVELWAVSQGLLDIVSSIIQEDYKLEIGRSNIVICATHTHTSAGNMSSNNYFNKYASGEPGFNKDYFTYVAKQLAYSINNAYQNKSKHSIFYTKHHIFHIAKNRSIEPFLTNNDSSSILNYNESMYSTNHIKKKVIHFKDKNFAVNPFVRLLLFKKKNKIKSMMSFISMHPIATGQDTCIYNSDVLGVARILLQSKNKMTVGFFQGTEGDITPNTSIYNKDVAIRLGKKLANFITDKMYEGNVEITGKILVNHKQVSLKNREFNYKHEYFGDTSNNTELYKTASCGISGFATVGGSSEDAPSILHDLGWRKGRSISKNCIDNCHAEKKEVMDYFGLSTTFCGILRKLILYGIEVPSEAPLTTVKLGPLVFATLPGEFTFTHQYRFEQRMKNIDDTILDSILLGLSNSYISYFTTHSEYELQHYEGSSTLYGKYSAYLVIQELENLINNKTVIDNSTYSYNHTKLGKKISLPKKFSKSNNCYKDLDNMLLENNVFSEIIVVPPTYDKYPKVSIEHKNNSRWKLLNINNIPQTSEHLNIISILRMKNKNVKAWEVIWLVPNDFDIDGVDLRFNIKADTDRLVIINEKHNIIKNTIIPSSVSNIVSSFINKFSSHTLKIDNKPYNIPLSRDINIEEVKNVKLLTYNTHLLFTYSSEKRLDVMINNILSIDADIVCLQEVFQVNYKYRIIESLINEYPYYVCCNNKDKDWIDENSGLLTLSKYPITDSKFKKYNDRKWHDSYATKGVLATTIDIGKELYVFNTHLQTMYNTKNSYIKILTKQLNEINSLIMEYSKDNDKIILVGDLNINGYTKHYNMLEDSLGKIGLKDIGINSKISTTNDGHERLDYIWISEKLENEYYKVKNLTSLYGHCSDHKVLITNIVSI